MFWLSECHLTAHHYVTKWTLIAFVEREYPVFGIVVCSKMTIISVKTHLKCAQLSHCEPLSCTSLCRLLRVFLMFRQRWTNSWGDPVSVVEGPVSNCDTGKLFHCPTEKEKSIDFLNSNITFVSLHLPAVSSTLPLRCCNACIHAFHRICWTFCYSWLYSHVSSRSLTKLFVDSWRLQV